ncbi:hypothetical protein EV182_005985, partial [Spiromyces aspiralis]
MATAYPYNAETSSPPGDLYRRRESGSKEKPTESVAESESAGASSSDNDSSNSSSSSSALGKVLACAEIPNFNNGQADMDKFKITKDSWGKQYRAFVKDPAGGTNKVLEITVPAGFYARSKDKGGTGFYADPVGNKQFASNKDALYTFEYDIYFPQGFEWVKGGKLPGQYGGAGSGEACSGGKAAVDCFSTRHMWRTNGMAELYVYADKSAQSSQYKATCGKYCVDEYGDSLERGKYTFKAGQWTHVKQTIGLNTPGQQDGYLQVSYDNETAIDINTMVWRNTDFGVNGIMFQIFFGGSTADWAPSSDQHIYFKNIKYM